MGDSQRVGQVSNFEGIAVGQGNLKFSPADGYTPKLDVWQKLASRFNGNFDLFHLPGAISQKAQRQLGAEPCH